MIKYLRQSPANVGRVPAHRYIRFVHGLDPTTPITQEEFVTVWRNQETNFGRDHWDKGREAEAIEALEWLVKKGFALQVNE